MHPRSPRGTQADFDALNRGRDMRIYAQYMRDQVRELLTNYGQIDILWCDFSFGPKWKAEEFDIHDRIHGPGPGKGHLDWESDKLAALVRELQPQCLVNNRLDLPGSGDFATPEQVQPDAPITDERGNPVPWEACQTFSGSWGYHREERSWKSVKMLLWMLIDGVSKGGNLLLNVGPTARGEFDHRARERLAGMGAWMRHHAVSIHGCVPAPAGLVPPPDCRYTYDPARRRLYLHLFNWPFGAIHLKGLGGKVEIARLLHDGGEIHLRDRDASHEGEPGRIWGNVMLHLPVEPPPVEVPVIELVLR
jgi:alpha-L-fucosidase